MTQRSDDLLAVLKSVYDIQRDFSGRMREVIAVVEGLVNAEARECGNPERLSESDPVLPEGDSGSESGCEHTQEAG